MLGFDEDTLKAIERTDCPATGMALDMRYSLPCTWVGFAREGRPNVLPFPIHRSHPLPDNLSERLNFWLAVSNLSCLDLHRREPGRAGSEPVVFTAVEGNSATDRALTAADLKTVLQARAALRESP